jgi:hypothetical protein
LLPPLPLLRIRRAFSWKPLMPSPTEHYTKTS